MDLTPNLTAHVSEVRPPNREYPYPGVKLTITLASTETGIKIDQAFELESKIGQRLKQTRAIEADQPARAIKSYQEAIEELTTLDRVLKPLNAARSVRMPIHRLSLVLERDGQLRECVEVIIAYLRMDDPTGLTMADFKSINTRLQRIQRKIEVS